MSLPVEITGKESLAGDGSALDALIDFYRSFNASDLKALAHLPGYEASNVNGISAPHGTSVQIINKINKEINASLADPKLEKRIADLGGTVFAGSPADFGKLILDEMEKWAAVVKFA